MKCCQQSNNNNNKNVVSYEEWCQQGVKIRKRTLLYGRRQRKRQKLRQGESSPPPSSSPSIHSTTTTNSIISDEESIILLEKEQQQQQHILSSESSSSSSTPHQQQSSVLASSSSSLRDDDVVSGRHRRRQGQEEEGVARKLFYSSNNKKKDSLPREEAGSHIAAAAAAALDDCDEDDYDTGGGMMWDDDDVENRQDEEEEIQQQQQQQPPSVPTNNYKAFDSSPPSSSAASPAGKQQEQEEQQDSKASTTGASTTATMITIPPRRNKRPRNKTFGGKSRQRLRMQQQQLANNNNTPIEFHVKPQQYWALVEGFGYSVAMADTPPKWGRTVELLPVCIAPGPWVVAVVENEVPSNLTQDTTATPSDWYGTRITLHHQDHHNNNKENNKNANNKDDENKDVETTTTIVSRVDPQKARALTLSQKSLQVVVLAAFDGFATKDEYQLRSGDLIEDVLDHMEGIEEEAEDYCCRPPVTAFPATEQTTGGFSITGSGGLPDKYRLLITQSQDQEVVAIEVVFDRPKRLSQGSSVFSETTNTARLTERLLDRHAKQGDKQQATTSNAETHKQPLPPTKKPPSKTNNNTKSHKDGAAAKKKTTTKKKKSTIKPTFLSGKRTNATSAVVQKAAGHPALPPQTVTHREVDGITNNKFSSGKRTNATSSSAAQKATGRPALPLQTVTRREVDGTSNNNFQTAEKTNVGSEMNAPPRITPTPPESTAAGTAQPKQPPPIGKTMADGGLHRHNLFPSSSEKDGLCPTADTQSHDYNDAAAVDFGSEADPMEDESMEVAYDDVEVTQAPNDDEFEQVICLHDVLFGVHDGLDMEYNMMTMDEQTKLELATAEPSGSALRDATFGHLWETSDHESDGRPLRHWLVSILFFALFVPFLVHLFYFLLDTYDNVNRSPTDISSDSIFAPTFISGEGFVGLRSID